jgi:hypothetical protein
MDHSSLPPMLLSEPRALQPAVPLVRNRRQGAFSGFCSACLACSGVCSPLTPRESLDAPEDLPKQIRCQAALGQLEDEVPRMPDEAPAGLEQQLPETRQGPTLDGEGQDEPPQKIAEGLLVPPAPSKTVWTGIGEMHDSARVEIGLFGGPERNHFARPLRVELALIHSWLTFSQAAKF